jgi:hypothetical protein
MSTLGWMRKNAFIVVLHLMDRALRAQAKRTNTEVVQTNVFIAAQLQLDHAARVRTKCMKNNIG